jgi:hypothetical protein
MDSRAEKALAEIKEILYPASDPDAEWSSDELPMVADVVNAYFDPDKPHEQFPCYCEAHAHAPDKWCHNSSEGGAVSDYVGNVCASCANDHLSDYIIWPTALHDGRHIFTVDEDHLIAMRRLNPDAYFGAIPTGDMFYVAATSDQVQRTKSGFEAYKAERERLGL